MANGIMGMTGAPSIAKKTKSMGVVAATTGSDYDIASLLTFANEGGYVNDPNDPGGETNFGISKRAYPNEDIRNLTVERAKFLGKRDYWYPMRLDTLNCQMIANNLFDFAFHHGVRSVGKKFQFLLAKDYGFKGLVDGIMGSQTLDFVNEVISSGQGAPFAIHQGMVKSRLEYYVGYAQSEYLKSFIIRATSFL